MSPMFSLPVTPTLYAIISLHDYLLFFLTQILFIVFANMITISVQYNSFWYNYFSSYRDMIRYTYHEWLLRWDIIRLYILEIWWTLSPLSILFLIYLPSLILLFIQTDFIDPSLTYKVVGHQWYWSEDLVKKAYYWYFHIPPHASILNRVGFLNSFISYLCSVSCYLSLIKADMFCTFDSHMLPDADLLFGQKRLLKTTMPIVLPSNTHVRLLITSVDVIHSFAVPAFGIKVDAVPGRINEVSVYAKVNGTFFGQCSELCGVNHAFMPIEITVCPPKLFFELVRPGTPVLVTSKEPWLTVCGSDCVETIAPRSSRIASSFCFWYEYWWFRSFFPLCLYWIDVSILGLEKAYDLHWIWHFMEETYKNEVLLRGDSPLLHIPVMPSIGKVNEIMVSSPFFCPLAHHKLPSHLYKIPPQLEAEILRDMELRWERKCNSTPEARIMWSLYTEFLLNVWEHAKNNMILITDHELQLLDHIQKIREIYYLKYPGCMLRSKYGSFPLHAPFTNYSHIPGLGDSLKMIYHALHQKKPTLTYEYALVHVPPEILRNELPPLPPLLASIPTDLADPRLLWVFIDNHPRILRVIPHILLQCTPLYYPEVSFVMYIYHIYDVLRDTVDIVISGIPCDIHGWCQDRPRWFNGMPIIHNKPFELYLNYLSYLKSVASESVSATK